MAPEVRNVPKGPSEVMGGGETEGGRARLWALSLAVQEVTCESEISWFLGHPSDQRTGFLRGEARHSLPRCFCSTQRTRTTGCGHPLSAPPQVIRLVSTKGTSGGFWVGAETWSLLGS